MSAHAACSECSTKATTEFDEQDVLMEQASATRGGATHSRGGANNDGPPCDKAQAMHQYTCNWEATPLERDTMDHET